MNTKVLVTAAGAYRSGAMETEPISKNRVNPKNERSRSKFCLAVITAALLLFCGLPMAGYAMSADQGSLNLTTLWQSTGSKKLGSIFFANQDDTYSFTATAGYRYEFELTERFGSAKITIYDANDRSVSSLDNLSGTHYVKISGNGALVDVKYNLAYRKVVNTYTVAYNGNGTTGGSTASSSHTYDEAKNLTTNGFTRTGYSFAGWATNPSGPVVYSNQQSVRNLTTTNGGTVTLYAKWTPITYTVSYNGNGNNGGSTASSTHTYDAAKNLTTNGFTRTGYSFAGWALWESW
ncbi:hypothetical protein FACS189413_13320 [Bacteroidia bacterium]|nr:hypothetical protein FACS189413_13320 [Bacteroidia bacterium]